MGVVRVLCIESSVAFIVWIRYSRSLLSKVNQERLTRFDTGGDPDLHLSAIGGLNNDEVPWRAVWWANYLLLRQSDRVCRAVKVLGISRDSLHKTGFRTPVCSPVLTATVKAATAA